MTAALVVDMQNDFAAKGVIYLKMEFRPDLSDLGPPDSPNRIKHLPGQVGMTVTAPDGRESRISSGIRGVRRSSTS